MRRTALPWLVAVLVACDATGEGEGETDGAGSESASATGITTTGPVTTAGGTSGDPPPPGTSCEMCIYGWCGDQAQACLADDDCSCWIGCTDTMTDDRCAALCGNPGGPLIELYQCLLQHCAQACATEETTGVADETDTGSQTDDESGTGGTEGTGTATDDDSTGGEAGSTETTR
jgi:hypothetical protein